jgi:CrcB protein
MPLLLQIAVGGAIGAALRYLMGARVSRMAGHAVPWGTLSVNVLGCLLMGLLAGSSCAAPTRGSISWPRSS